MMILGIYVYNSDRDEWLQEDQKSWGPFSSAFEWHEIGEVTAEEVRLAISAGETTFVMAALH
jgi:hypothetical protein